MKIFFLQTLFLLFGAFAVHDGHALGTNWARSVGASANQSSLYHARGAASHGIDGNTNGNYNAAFSCTHTQDSNQPWWRVDLGSQKTVARVDIYNRIDCCTARLNNFKIRVGDSTNYKSNSVCLKRLDFSNVEFAALICKKPLIGRYVSVHLAGNGYLTLCEVEVYSDLE